MRGFSSREGIGFRFPGATCPSGQRRIFPPLAFCCTTIHSVKLGKWGGKLRWDAMCPESGPVGLLAGGSVSQSDLGVVCFRPLLELFSEGPVADSDEQHDREGDGEEDEAFHDSGGKDDDLLWMGSFGRGPGHDLVNRLGEDHAQEVQVGKLLGGLETGVGVGEGLLVCCVRQARRVVFHLCSCCS